MQMRVGSAFARYKVILEEVGNVERGFMGFLKRFACTIIFLTIPAISEAQILEPAVPVSESLETTQALETLCSTQAALYELIGKYGARISEIDRRRERQERITIEIEQQAKLDPDSAKGRVKTAEEASFDALESPCAALDKELDAFIVQREGELRRAVSVLTAATESLNEADRADFASKFADCSERFNTKESQKVIYACVYRQKNIRNVPLSYSVEKTLRRLFAIQEPLINTWLGNVD